MQAFIFIVLTPVIPFLLRRIYHREERPTLGAAMARYAVYTLFMTAITTAAMVFLCEEGTSFLDKMDRSPGFALKFLLIELSAGFLTAALEWLYEGRRVALYIDKEGFKGQFLVRLVRKIVFPAALFVLAFAVIALNVTMIFDNVLWGDEAFSANLVKNSLPDMMQVITLEDPHPPLYYLWLKLCVQLLGHTGWVYHLASLIPVILGIVLAVTVVRKRYGAMPSAVFVIVSGLSAISMEYNLEIRMYSLAFVAVSYCFLSAASVLNNNKVAGWIFMVLCALLGAYTHYYALLAAGVILALTCIGACIRFRGRTWIKGAAAALAFFLGYLPWLGTLFKAVSRVEGNWWMTEAASLNDCITVILGGDQMKKILLPLILAVVVIVLAAESSLLVLRKKEDKLLIELKGPKSSGWSCELWGMLLGMLTIAGTLAVAYLACVLIRPVLARRYVYPLEGVAALVLVIGFSRILALLREWGNRIGKSWIEALGKLVLALILGAMLLTGLEDYRVVSAEAGLQQEKTDEVLALIEAETHSDSLTLVNNGISHIGWTVLSYYYPDADILNCSYGEVEAKDFWYFTPGYLSGEELEAMGAAGYQVGAYGEKQLVKYPLVLYHFFKANE